jgi:8-oxo-dGTP pyrophosphatase MutT (NUDIX family)
MKKKIRKGAAAVIFRKKGKETEFLVLHRIKRWKGWEMLKGGRRGREKPPDTLKREMMEELGALNFNLIGKIPFTLYFKIDKKHVREMGYTHMKFPVFLVEYNGLVVTSGNTPKEHSGHKWVPFKKALKMLTFSTGRQELKAAHKYMKSKCII